MTNYITKTGTTTYNKAKFKMNDRQRLRVVACQHNATATAIPASNVVNMIFIPADSIILSVAVDVSDNQTNTDIKVGVTADDDVFSAATALDANGTTILPSSTGTAHGTMYYTNANTNIVATAVTNAINAAVFTIRAVYIEMDAQVSVS